ncbi:prepilin-type N-terminal cleavage/methylation domain-containing protein [Lentisphaera profundi]|uniref:Prepilin-type N-terminal cleavage/methylation domain-containing protein n=1 Tax=Lentisphaera profundi TaxID=1658616 RepID=A0ABY7VUI5_9BACT|nr:prepilin-type N-terminal cleavage/methylation domain-containing protein [Lentisphaera profundi]WDE96491.1 prepilin-type N-terminal cleavage/methylation domain-containing protein [Lentisphaera profundi]
MTSNKKKQNFSLIELLVIVAIIGILASLLLPSLSKARKRAKITVCKNNQKQIITAIFMYAEDNKGHLPGHFNRITYDKFLGTGYDGRTSNTDGKLYSCPTDETDTGTNRNRSYSAIQGILSGRQSSKRGAIDEGSGESLTLSDFTYPSDTIIITERHNPGNTIGKWNSAMMKMNVIQRGTVNGDYPWSHGKFKFNHIFPDGSVRAIPHATTYAGSGVDPWSNASMFNTMWDSLR